MFQEKGQKYKCSEGSACLALWKNDNEVTDPSGEEEGDGRGDQRATRVPILTSSESK